MKKTITPEDASILVLMLGPYERATLINMQQNLTTKFARRIGKVLLGREKKPSKSVRRATEALMTWAEAAGMHLSVKVKL